MLQRTNSAFACVIGVLLAGALGLVPTAPSGALTLGAQEKIAPPDAEPPAPDSALRFQLKGHRAEIKALALVPHSDRLLTLDTAADVRCWNLKSGAEQYKIGLKVFGSSFIGDNQPGYYSPLAVSPDGCLAAVCEGEFNGGVVQVYDLREKKKVQEFKPTELFGGALSLAFSTQGDRLAIALHGYGALQWSLGEAKSLTPAKSAALPLDVKNKNRAMAVTQLRGDDVLAVGFFLQDVHFYDARSGAELGSYSIPVQPKHLPSEFYQLALSEDGGLLLAVARQGSAMPKPDDMIHVWDMTTGEKVWTFTHEKFHVTQAALSPDGRYIAVGFYNDPAVRLYRLADGKEMAAFKGHSKGVTCIAFSADGRLIASGSMDKTAIVWGVKEGLLPAAERPKADKDLTKAWDTLLDGKPLKALEAIAALAAAKDDGVVWLEGKLSPARKPDTDRVRKLIEQLNHEDQPKRDEASRELGALGAQVEAELKKALESPPSEEVKRRLKELLQEMRPLWVRDRDAVRAVRAIYVLERVGSERAVKLLKKLAEGDPAARLTREAKISLERIEVRKPPKDK
jgi:hypothetical protein